MKANLRPEAELLLHCARRVLESPGRERIVRLLDSGLEWSYLLRLASRHGLLPLLYAHLNAIAPAATPRNVLVELWGCHESTSRRNRTMANELLGILQLLDSNGIEAIPYKGPTLALSVYGDVALREFGDLDLLLRPRDVPQAAALLEAQGFVPKFPLGPAAQAAFLCSRAQYHLVLIHTRRDIVVELHWKTDPDFPVERIDDDSWWADLRIAVLGEGSVRSFTDRELLLILCLHGTKHGWSSLGWLVDVAELIRQHPEMDWKWIIVRAQSLACTRRLALGLLLAHHLVDAPLPEEVRSRISASPEVEKLAARIIATLFTPDAREMSAMQALRFNLSLYESPRQRLRHCVNAVLTPSLIEWSRWPLPRPLFFLYPPLRLIRLTGKYALKSLNRI